MVGLTGGIGSGKSTVAEILVKRGAVVIDADAIARGWWSSPARRPWPRSPRQFGPEILRADGSLDRAALAERAFVTDETRKQLEAITHPAIAEEFFARIAAAPADGIVVHDVPLLVESTRGYEYGAVIVVEAPTELRLARLEARGVDRGRRRTADGAAGLRRGAAQGGDVGHRQLRRPRRPGAPDRRDLARARERAQEPQRSRPEPPETT